MRIVNSVSSMQRLARRWRRAGVRVAFVPTMGYLHEGHLSLVERARTLAGKQGKVVVSVFVNPTQFGPKEDLTRYPRDLKRDRRLCAARGVDVLFAPGVKEMYPARSDDAFSTYVIEESLSRGMEGRSRPTHFRGVTTVVAKLFNIVLPDVAIFGAKDFQQAAVVRRMTRDLNFPVGIVVAPIRREPDGLALSSRNRYLRGDLRGQAVVLSQVIQKAKSLVAGARAPLAADGLRRQLRRWIEGQPAARVDYIEFFDPRTLRPVRKVRRGTHLALAVFIGRTRLIDNAGL